MCNFVNLKFDRMAENKITKLFGIKYPLIQAGMIWCSGWELASAVSNAGGLGIIGSGSMYPQVLDEHIRKCKEATDKPFAVNLPMLYPSIDEHIKTIIKYKVPIVFTSAGNPKTWTALLKENGITVVHVVSSLKFALKSQEAGVDAVVVEGFEAGGHNGLDETTTFTLVPTVKQEVTIPIIAAGGIATGRGMLAAMTLGADAVQIGSRFVASEESSSHQNFKNKVVETGDGGTRLTLKELLGRGRAKKGMFEGDLDEGELEIGQVASIINEIKPAASIVAEIITEYRAALSEMNADKYQF